LKEKRKAYAEIAEDTEFAEKRKTNRRVNRGAAERTETARRIVSWLRTRRVQRRVEERKAKRDFSLRGLRSK